MRAPRGASILALTAPSAQARPSPFLIPAFLSATAAIVAAERVLTALDRIPPPSTAVVVVIAPDSGDRYLSERGRLAGERR